VNNTGETGLPESLPGFDDPLALLRACHTKILDHCDLLEQLVSQVQAQGDETELRDSARKLITYFSGSARLHHQDEETDLFPLLARQSLKLADLVHALRQEHEELDALWAVLETGLKQVTQLDDPEPFSATATRFCALSRQHVQRENMEFLPVAASSLSSEQIKDIGMAMAGRRGVRFSG
jgi:hemerythrin-like domain-containing protein